jgi:hypothetical protein
MEKRIPRKIVRVYEDSNIQNVMDRYMEYREIIKEWQERYPDTRCDYEISIGKNFHRVKLTIYDYSKEG